MKTSNKVNGAKTAKTVKTIVAKSDKEIVKEVAKQVRENDKSTKKQIKTIDVSIKGLRTKLLAYNSDTLIELNINDSYLKALRLSKKDTTVFQTIDAGSKTVSGKNSQSKLIDFLRKNIKVILGKDAIALSELKKETIEKLDVATKKYEERKAERLALKEAQLKEEETSVKAKQVELKANIKTKQVEVQTTNA